MNFKDIPDIGWFLFGVGWISLCVGIAIALVELAT